MVEKGIEGYQTDKSGNLLRKSPQLKIVGSCRKLFAGIVTKKSIVLIASLVIPRQP